MKCPYRKITKHQQMGISSTDTLDVEEFAECYGNECPFYYERWQIIDVGTGSRGNVPHCRKSEKEGKA